MYSAGLLVGVLEPNQPVIITPSRYRTPNAPQIALNQAKAGAPARPLQEFVKTGRKIIEAGDFVPFSQEPLH